ncbi:MAG: hypothetical protein HC837_05285 [Chloroflexaceae bacterium]|nr:hypothetical protein [Chloroflexaceae bacterium]
MPEIAIREVASTPIRLADVEVTPIKWVFQVRWKGGGLAWHRPAAVEIVAPETIERRPIEDTTMRQMLQAIASVLVLGLLAWLATRIRR